LLEEEVQNLLDELKKKHLVSDRTGFGSRVAKYQHRFCNTGFGALEFSSQELGIICVLLLRGPQTPGELRGRTNRLCQFSDVHEVESVLDGLMQRQDGPFVVRLARELGRRESRYAHLFSGDVEETIEVDRSSAVEADMEGGQPSRIEQLESMVSEMRKEIDNLKLRIDQLESGHK
jgi:uncharacterized protein YceH (UPF0502 family)